MILLLLRLPSKVTFFFLKFFFFLHKKKLDQINSVQARNQRYWGSRAMRGNVHVNKILSPRKDVNILKRHNYLKILMILMILYHSTNTARNFSLSHLNLNQPAATSSFSLNFFCSPRIGKKLYLSTNKTS